MTTTTTEQVKAIISTSGSKFMSVTFKKANGEIRTINFNPRTAKGLKGDDASDSAKQAVATRKRNNPNLVNVCDQQLLNKGEDPAKCWRSINCDTVLELKTGNNVLFINPLFKS